MVEGIRRFLRYVRWRLGLSILLVGSLALGGCSPVANTTLPPATVIAPRPPTETAMAPKPPTATPEQSAGAPSPTPTEVISQAKPRQAVTLTILHTNDVFGEADPCG